jgi:hypothetical protein
VLELRGDAGLAQEARGGGCDAAALGAGLVDEQLLERDLAPGVLVEGDQDPADSAAAVLASQLVAARLLERDGDRLVCLARVARSPPRPSGRCRSPR